MKILGLSHPYSWNNAACLLVDGRLIAFAEEERFNRLKYAPNMAPVRAMEYCLKEGGITLKEIDSIAIGFDPIPQIIWGNLFNQSPHFAYKKIKRAAWGILRGNALLPFDVNDRRVVFINHHDAHIASSFFLSGFEQSNIISFDGAGGGEAGKLGFGSGTDVEIFERIPNEASWGRLYETITGLLGFKRHADEGKVMGLAPYGKSRGDFDFIDFHDDIPRIIPSKFYTYINAIIPRQKDEPLTEYHKDIAATLQANLEKAGLQMLRHLVSKTGNRNLCLAGGVALNCAMNGKMISSGLIDNIFVQPVSSDAGTALGAAVAVHVQKTGRRPDVVFDHLYWGPRFSNEQIQKLLNECGVSYTREENIAAKAAQLLSQDKVLGFFHGRMEAGPRALGGRSILANPANPGMKDIVNNRVKKREPWRPFAPSILEEYAPQYAQNYYKSPFMILAFQARKEKLSQLVSAAHVDESIRVQAVSKKTNPKYWQLIDEFRKITGIPAVLNTSFNKAGEPIVCTPEDALRTFFASGLDYLVLEDFLVSKR